MAGVAAMTSAFAAFEARGAAKGKAVGVITIVEQNAPLPSAEARRAMAEFLSTRRGRIAASAVVFEGAGFRAAAVRGVVTGLTLVAQQPFPHRVFAVVKDAAAWICGAGPAEWTGQAPRLDGAVAALRSPSR